MNAPVSHQNIRLSRGRHSSPEHGVCVMELASMLAGERFTDHPKTVSPSIAAFLRAYNDRVDDERRQDLYALASACVGTRGSLAAERQRAEICREWLQSRTTLHLSQRFGWIMRFTPPGRARMATGAAHYASLVRARHADALELVRMLIGDDGASSRAPELGHSPVCSTG